MATTRIGDVLSVAQDAMLERLDRGEPVAWLELSAPGGYPRVVLAVWDVSWRIYVMSSSKPLLCVDGSLQPETFGQWLGRPWKVERVRKALLSAICVIDPETSVLDRVVRRRRHTATPTTRVGP